MGYMDYAARNHIVVVEPRVMPVWWLDNVETEYDSIVALDLDATEKAERVKVTYWGYEYYEVDTDFFTVTTRDSKHIYEKFLDAIKDRMTTCHPYTSQFEIPMNVMFQNMSEGSVELQWFNNEGVLVPYWTLDAGDAIRLDTFESAKWTIGGSEQLTLNGDFIWEATNGVEFVIIAPPEEFVETF